VVPHSDNLPAELPDLLAVLSVRLGPISRVVFGLDEWATASRKSVIGERIIRLDGYHIQPAHTVEVLRLNGQKAVLLVVSPDADPGQAHTVMMTAAGPDNVLTVADLLSTDSEILEQHLSG
jgi:hypothetical protein